MTGNSVPQHTPADNASPQANTPDREAAVDELLAEAGAMARRIDNHTSRETPELGDGDNEVMDAAAQIERQLDREITGDWWGIALPRHLLPAGATIYAVVNLDNPCRIQFIVNPDEISEPVNWEPLHAFAREMRDNLGSLKEGGKLEDLRGELLYREDRGAPNSLDCLLDKSTPPDLLPTAWPTIEEAIEQLHIREWLAGEATDQHDPSGAHIKPALLDDIRKHIGRQYAWFRIMNGMTEDNEHRFTIISNTENGGAQCGIPEGAEVSLFSYGEAEGDTPETGLSPFTIALLRTGDGGLLLSPCDGDGIPADAARGTIIGEVDGWRAVE